jgi:XTP/dITP diphosphohydrolase
MRRLVIATHNRGKLAEIRTVLGDAAVELIALSALADDSGLTIDALDGRPGLVSAHYAGVHGDAAGNIVKVLDELRGVDDAQRGASFLSVIVLLRHAEDPAPIVVEGRWRGRILLEPRGTGGFGYDPIFFDPVLGVGAAELEPERKNQVSHRGQALSALRARWSEWA